MAKLKLARKHMRGKPIKLGKRFGRLKVLKSFIDAKQKATVCYCLCDCGNMTSVRPIHLRDGSTKSCGCLRIDNIREARKRWKKHGKSRTPEYWAWHNMIWRCTHPEFGQWNDYGGRGITVRQRWLKGFPNFFKDMGPKPSPELTLERFDNNDGYKPSNCFWATRKEQQLNRRNLPPPMR